MHLWNDYEGRTIADIYTLGPLLRPEGRSAFFALNDGAGGPAVIRLTEALNDETQMLTCWRRVTELDHENLLRIMRFGQTTFEGTPLTYAVMEATDANLADLLKERPLTYEETMQVATSVAAALTALHAKGLVHEHIDPANVLAVGETVKLRADCVRECIVSPEYMTPAEYQEIVRRDVQDFATLLLQSLTLEKKLSPKTKLPAPFDKTVPNAMNGTWGLPEISTALTPPAVTPLVPGDLLRPNDTGSRVPGASVQSEPVPALGQQSVAAHSVADYEHRHRRDDVVPATRHRLLWAGCACVLILVLMLSLHVRKSKAAASARVAAARAIATPATGTATARTAKAAPTPAPHQAVQTPMKNRLAVTAHMQPGWYVIAYTYDREDQAWRRVAEIMRQHPWLNPEVITPSGHTPFLISLGGAMSRVQAEAARTRARRAGMPRDTLVRNYEVD